jgi:NADH oxidase (H2O-forming)
MTDDKILKVSEDVSWIGVLDPDIVTFDIVMETHFGTTYNSYFINAEKKTIIETVKIQFWETYLEKLKRVMDPSEIEYIIMNHTEPDHSGSLANLLKLAPNATVVSSGAGYRYLTDLLGFEFRHMQIKDCETLDLGNKTLQFFSAPNLHWPDSILTYLKEDRLLFSCDIFGEHYCHEEIFNDQSGDFDEAFKYYFDVIMKPFSKFMIKAIEKVRQLQIEAICPGHGVILRSNWKKYVDLSEQYALEALKEPLPNSVLLAYVSAYGNTSLIAAEIAEGIRLAGDINVDVCDIEKTDLTTLEEKIIHSEAIIIGCPTFNQNILLPVFQMFALINPIRDKGKLAGTFGSFGWSGEGVKIMNTNLTNLKLKLFDEGLMIRFTPHDEVLKKCVDYGKAFGETLLKME